MTAVAERAEPTAAEVIAWLDSPEGQRWQRARRCRADGGSVAMAELYELDEFSRWTEWAVLPGPVNPEYDPCGRGPLRSTSPHLVH